MMNARTERSRRRLDVPSAFLLGAAAGTGLAYFLDEHSGRRRRKLVTDKLVRAASRSDDAVGRVVRDARNRVLGAAAGVELPFRSGDVDDGVLEERVRQALHRMCSDPGAVTVQVLDGRA